MSQTVKPMRLRAEKKISRAPANGCWNWTGAQDRKGYGRLWSFEAKAPVLAHRVVYEYSRGKIPTEMQIDHLCRNPRCVNPHHMEVVTSRENTLRGNSPCARHARKTHCKRGHRFEGSNLRLIKNGQRCLACRTINWQDWYSKNKRRGK